MRDPRLRAFVRIDKLGNVVPSSLILRRKPPENGLTHHWFEIEANMCCSIPISNWEFTDGATLLDGVFTITVGGALVVDATNTQAGTFAAGAGQTVVINLTGSGPTKTLLVVDDTSGAILSNQTGTTGALTYTYTAPGLHVYSVIASQNNTTTTTTTTTSTSTTSTSTTSTTSTSTSTTTTSTTTGVAGSFTVTNAHQQAGITITGIGPGANFTGGTYPIAINTSTVSTIAVAGTASITLGIGSSVGAVTPATATLFKNGTPQETIGVITAAGTYTFGSISFLTSDRLQIIFN